VCWHLNSDFTALLDALEQYVAGLPDPVPADSADADAAGENGGAVPASIKGSAGKPTAANSTFFWISGFTARFDEDTSKMNEAKKQELDSVARCVNTIKSTVLFLDPWTSPSASPLNRTWCLWELFHTVQGNHNLDVIMTSDKETEFMASVSEDNTDHLQNSLTSINFEKSHTTDATDKKVIIDSIKQKTQGKVPVANMRVAGRIVGWLALQSAKAELAAMSPKDRATSDVTNQIGALLQEQGKLPEAEILYRDSLTECKSQLGKDHPTFPLTMYNLGKVLLAQNKAQEAEGMLSKALVGLREQLGTWNSATIQCIGLLARCQEELNNLTEAEDLFAEVLMLARELGRHAPGHTQHHRQPGRVMKSQGKLEEAKVLLKEAADARQEKLGEAHPETKKAQQELGLVERLSERM